MVRIIRGNASRHGFDMGMASAPSGTEMSNHRPPGKARSTAQSSRSRHMPARCASGGGDRDIDDLARFHRVGERRFECGPGGRLIAAPHLEQNIERRLRKVGEGRRGHWRGR